jgi:DNA-binding LytR/AlgR family response regulator
MEKPLLNTIAIDDEPLALKLVTGYILRTPLLTFCGGFDSTAAALDYMKNSRVDLIFLDIRMPDMKGTDFARSLGGGAKIIFTTAYEKYALEGFKLDAVDYLLKPFEYQEFLNAATKAQRLIGLEQKTDSTLEANDQFLFLKSDYKIRRINFDDILYIEGLKDYVKVFLRGESKPVLSISSLKNLQDKLPSRKFMRVHRSFIVNLDRIETIERSRIVFGKVYIPVSEQYKERFQEYLDNYFL